MRDLYENRYGFMTAFLVLHQNIASIVLYNVFCRSDLGYLATCDVGFLSSYSSTEVSYYYVTDTLIQKY
jgi:hypothetical protein